MAETLSVPFGAAPGLRDIAFAVGPGERLALVGSSGAGKTTLLRAVAGLAPITGGRVLIGQRDVTVEPPERRGAVYLHQSPLLFPHLDVARNVRFPLAVRGVRSREASERVDRALAAVQMESFGGRMPRTLSGGQRHRVALARAIVAEPAVLLLDEPLSSLDPALRAEVRDALRAAQEAYGPAMIVVTHDLAEAGLLTDRIGLLLGGTIAQLATPAELFRHPASLEVARFLGFPNEMATGDSVAIFPPEALQVADSGSLQGRVLELQHRPGALHVVVLVNGQLLIASAQPTHPPAVGSHVCLAFNPDLAACFPVTPPRS
jgi:ABC-type sugar transport system ATPase subunit